MASRSKRLDTNVDGDFFVDSTCIDCATCRWMAPETFDYAGGASRVHTQPSGDAVHRALLALVSCPTASIGTVEKHAMAPVLESFPIPIDGPVYHAGFHSEASFGATSYLIRRPEGNVLVDSPRWASKLRARLEAMGGVKLMFLTHRDDVADHAKWAEAFGCTRVMHEADLSADTRGVEHVLTGDAPIAVDSELSFIPTPGHTRGSTCLLFRERYLFTGDHLALHPRRKHLYAFRDANWYDWATTIASVERLKVHRFEWVLPGHGERARYDADAMPRELERCLEWMRRVA